MLRNDFDTFDELVRGKLTDYTEPPNQESLSMIHAKKARVSSLYQVYRLLMVLLVAGIGMLASTLLVNSTNGGKQPDTSTTQSSEEMTSVQTTVSVTEFASVPTNTFASANHKSFSNNNDRVTQNTKDKASSIYPYTSSKPKSKKSSDLRKNLNEASSESKNQKKSNSSEPLYNPAQPLFDQKVPGEEHKSRLPETESDSVATSSKTNSSCEVAFNYYGSYTGAFTFSAAVENSAKSTLTWDFGDGQTSTETTPVHTYNKPGVYTVTLMLTDIGKQCKAQTSKELILYASAPPVQPLLLKGSLFGGNEVIPNGTIEVFTLNRQTSKYNSELLVKTNAEGNFEIPIKAGFSYLLKGYPGANLAGYQPTFWGNTTTPDNASEIVINEGEQLDLLGYNIQLVSSEATIDPEDIEPLPVSAGTDHQVVLVDGNNNVVGMGHIDQNGNVVANVGTKAGNYTAVNPTTGRSSNIEVNEKGEVSSFEPISSSNEKVEVFPNPAENMVNFRINTHVQESAVLVVMNAAGFELVRRTIECSSGFNQLQYDISGFSPGIYYVMVFKGNQQVMSNRIVKMGDVIK